MPVPAIPASQRVVALIAVAINLSLAIYVRFCFGRPEAAHVYPRLIWAAAFLCTATAVYLGNFRPHRKVGVVMAVSACTSLAYPLVLAFA